MTQPDDIVEEAREAARTLSERKYAPLFDRLADEIARLRALPLAAYPDYLAQGAETFDDVWADYTRNPRTVNASIQVCRHFFDAGLRAQVNPEAECERAVGQYVYHRISCLMDAKAGTDAGHELKYLADLVSDVEEYGATGEDAPPSVAPPAQPEGRAEGAEWVLVPREPGACELDDSGWLLEFVRALHVYIPEAMQPVSWSDFTDGQRERLKAAYRAMIAARPPPPPAIPADVDRLRALLAEAVGNLVPFAAAAEQMDRSADEAMAYPFGLAVADFRAARSLVARLRGEAK